jgi:hypothetical protein
MAIFEVYRAAQVWWYLDAKAAKERGYGPGSRSTAYAPHMLAEIEAPNEIECWRAIIARKLIASLSEAQRAKLLLLKRARPDVATDWSAATRESLGA